MDVGVVCKPTSVRDWHGRGPDTDREETAVPRRLIDAAVPLWEASLDSVYEKNVWRGHISILNVWPAPLPRTVSQATLFPDPETRNGRRELQRRTSGLIEEEVGADEWTCERRVGDFVAGMDVKSQLLLPWCSAF